MPTETSIPDETEQALMGCFTGVLREWFAVMGRVLVAVTVAVPLTAAMRVVHAQQAQVPTWGYWATAGGVFLVKTALDLLVDVARAVRRRG